MRFNYRGNSILVTGRDLICNESAQITFDGALLQEYGVHRPGLKATFRWKRA